MSETEKVLKERASKLSSLQMHPGWEELKEEFERKKEKHLRLLVSSQITSGKPVDQRLFDLYRGFWACGTWLLANPEMAESSLERALRTMRGSEE